MKILRIGTTEAKNYIDRVVNRSAYTRNLEKKVCSIVKDVQRNGDAAILKYTKKFDSPGMTLKDLKVRSGEILDSYDCVERENLSAVDRLIKRIREFEKKVKQKSWMKEKKGVIVGQYVMPLEKVGIYVPGGAASYVSSFLMCAVPAKLAGVKKITVVSPPDKKGKLNPYLLVAANRLGINEIYKVGGVQAIAGLAYGTRILPKVDKIVGPGNIYVTLAKKIVFGDVGIDFLAGPTEVVILADSYANAGFIACDLLSQAEHSQDALAVCITPSLQLAQKILKEIKTQTQDLSRKSIINTSLKNSAIILTENVDRGVGLINQIAPEHAEIFVKNPFSLLNKITNAGAIFLGSHTPVSIGDYMAGPSHVLPTSGSARFFSPLSIKDFMKVSNVISCTPRGIKGIGKMAMRIAKIEGLDGHIRSIEARMAK